MPVTTKFVMATVRDVRVGTVKPTRVNIVAEKYIREFCKRKKSEHVLKYESRGDVDLRIHITAVILEVSTQSSTLVDFSAQRIAQPTNQTTLAAN